MSILKVEKIAKEDIKESFNEMFDIISRDKTHKYVVKIYVPNDNERYIDVKIDSDEYRYIYTDVTVFEDTLLLDILDKYNEDYNCNINYYDKENNYYCKTNANCMNSLLISGEFFNTLLKRMELQIHNM